MSANIISCDFLSFGDRKHLAVTVKRTDESELERPRKLVTDKDGGGVGVHDQRNELQGRGGGGDGYECQRTTDKPPQGPLGARARWS